MILSFVLLYSWEWMTRVGNLLACADVKRLKCRICFRPILVVQNL